MYEFTLSILLNIFFCIYMLSNYIPLINPYAIPQNTKIAYKCISIKLNFLSINSYYGFNSV